MSKGIEDAFCIVWLICFLGLNAFMIYDVCNNSDPNPVEQSELVKIIVFFVAGWWICSWFVTFLAIEHLFKGSKS